MKKFSRYLILVLLSICMLITATGCSSFVRPEGSINGGVQSGNKTPTASVNTVMFTPQSESTRQKTDLVDAIAKVERSVVAIKTDSAAGSGVIVDATRFNADNVAIDGDNVFFIVTCHHVIADAKTINVYIPDENCRNFKDSDYDTKYSFSGVIDNKMHPENAVQLIGSDKDSDIAVLKVDISNSGIDKSKIVQAKVPVSSYAPRRGESVFAVGNSSGELPGTVTDGIISYLYREVSVGEVGEMVLHQMDTEIYHGNSGGGLFNMYGELIGITNAGSDEYIGINYFIPYEITSTGNGYVNIAKHLMETANEDNYGYVQGRWTIGVVVENKADRNGEYLQVKEIVAGSNASKSTLKVGDIITAVKYTVGGENVTYSIKNSQELGSALSVLKKNIVMGGSFTLSIQRHENFNYQAKDIVINVTVQEIFCNTGYVAS